MIIENIHPIDFGALLLAATSSSVPEITLLKRDVVEFNGKLYNQTSDVAFNPANDLTGAFPQR